MARKSKFKRALKPLTATELEMMNIIWRIGPCSVTQVQEALLPERDLAYTSVSTMVRILEQKGFVTSTKEGRGHLYEAAISKGEYQAMSVKALVHNVFDGAPSTLVRCLLDAEKLSEAELAQISALLKKRGNSP